MIEQMQQAYAEFEQALELVEALSAKGEHEEAVATAQRAANRAWLEHCGIFTSPRLERALAALATVLPPATPVVRSTQGQRKVALVATRAFSIGGHSRILWRWAELDRNTRHTIVLTQQGDAPLPEQIETMQAAGEVEVALIEGRGWLGRAAALRDVFAEHDAIILLTHPDDPLPCIAVPALSVSVPVLVLDHASHTFWLGASIANKVIGMDSRLEEERRGMPAEAISWIPLPLDFERLEVLTPENAIRRQYDIPENAPLLLSCGAAYKFWPIDGVGLATLVAPALARHRDTHLLVVGATASPAWEGVLAEYPDRIHLAGGLPEQTLVACYQAADIYLDSAPFSSPTALIEAAAAGLPVLSFCPPSLRDSAFLPWLGTIPRAAVTAASPGDYTAQLHQLISEPEYRAWRAAFGRECVRNSHAKATFLNTLEATYAALGEGCMKIRIDEDQTAWRYALLDRQLLELAENMRAQEACMAAATGDGSGLQPQSLSMEDWLALRTFDEVVRRQIAAHAAGRLSTLLVEFFLVLEDASEGEALLAQFSSIKNDLAEMFPSISWPQAYTLTICHPETLEGRLADSQASWIFLLNPSDRLIASGLVMALTKLLDAEEVWAISCDALFVDTQGQVEGAAFRPAFNLDYTLSFPAGMGRQWFIKREWVTELGGTQGRSAQVLVFDLMLRFLNRNGVAGFDHLAEPLLLSPNPILIDDDEERECLLQHLRGRGYEDAELHFQGGGYRIVYNHPAQPLVSIIVPTRDQLPMLLRCVTSLLEKTKYPNYELLIVDNDSQEQDARDWLAGVEGMGESKVRVLRYPYPFNYSAMNNLAARAARGEYLLLLNNDTAIIQDDWLDNLINHALRPEVGIVGAKLLYPNGSIQHAGVVLGLRGPADHPFLGKPLDDTGYMQRLQIDQNYSAVTAACLLIRASVYQAVGGLDESAFKVSYNDVDLCLKVKEAGYLSVWTPHSLVMHEGSVSQNTVDTAALKQKSARFYSEQVQFYARWLPLVAKDPAYNGNLSLNGNGFEVEMDSDLTWRPLSWKPLPVVMAHMGDASGCGNYRVIKPFEAMRDEGVVDGKLSHVMHGLPDLARYEPDSIIMQRQLSGYFHDWIERVGKTTSIFKVYELDDYLPNLPLKSVHRGSFSKDTLRSLRKSLGLVDRFVVSTEPLAEALAGMHADIRVVKNRLPVDWWGALSSVRRRGGKPRVGWAGGSGHTGDLELIADVVKDLADEVEWVFFGMCPDRLRPYVHEFHHGVKIEEYPAKLASLNLDLALAPLEDNLFNRCKSNLRLLEYGICGFPVICSDIEPYRDGFAVTRVRNRYKEWVDAIRGHLADLDASAAMGDALRNQVQTDWMLSGSHLQTWRDAWLPG